MPYGIGGLACLCGELLLAYGQFLVGFFRKDADSLGEDFSAPLEQTC